MDEMEMMTLETDVPMSNSLLWEWSRNYYLEAGVNAWEKTIPHYITSNPFIANSYAEVILEFINEWVTHHPEALQAPFYLLELGAGHAKFSFYLLKRLMDMQSSWPTDLKLCYVISDFSEKNIEFFSSHPNFQCYIEQGLVDFAQFDLDSCNSIFLRIKQKELTQQDLVNPLIICANYILDSIKSDFFYVDERYKLHASLVNLKTRANNLRAGVPVQLDQMNVDFSLKSVAANHYESKLLNEILLMYNQELNKRSFSVPISAFGLIDHLSWLSNQRMIMLASDKGYVSPVEFSTAIKPHIAFHGGCFSLTINFDAIKRYVSLQGGDAFIQSESLNLSSCAFLMGISFAQLPKTHYKLKECFGRFSPSDYYNFYVNLPGLQHEAPLSFYIAYLKFCCYDPFVFSYILPAIQAGLSRFNQQDVQTLKGIVSLIAAQFYYMPGEKNCLFDVGLFFHLVHEYKQALRYYHQSEQFFGENFNTLYNLGLCYYYLHEFHEAELHFRKAYQLKSDFKVKQWLARVRKKNAR